MRNPELMGVCKRKGNFAVFYYLTLINKKPVQRAKRLILGDYVQLPEYVSKRPLWKQISWLMRNEPKLFRS